MAFRYEGYNWEGREWQTVPAITALGLQIEEVRGGTLSTDGTVASRGHDERSPRSDHRPDYEDGDVSAIDFGGSPEFLAEVFESIRLSKDPRVKYAIHNQQIFSSYNHADGAPYTLRPYSGSPHTHHIHISVTDAQQNDGTPWAITTQEEQEAAPVALTDYEQAAIDSLLADGVFTQYTVDEEGEVHAEVQLKKLAVFLQRIMDRQEASDAALWESIRDIEAGGSAAPDLSGYVQKGEQVTLI